MTDPDETARKERMRRWRLVLGGPAEEALGGADGRDGKMDAALSALYDAGESDGESPTARTAGLGGSAPGWPAGWATSASTSPAPSSR